MERHLLKLEIGLGRVAPLMGDDRSHREREQTRGDHRPKGYGDLLGHADSIQRRVQSSGVDAAWGLGSALSAWAAEAIKLKADPPRQQFWTYFPPAKS